MKTVRPPQVLPGKYPVSGRRKDFPPRISVVRPLGSVPLIPPIGEATLRAFSRPDPLKESYELTRYYCCRSLRRRLGRCTPWRTSWPATPAQRPHRRRGASLSKETAASGLTLPRLMGGSPPWSSPPTPALRRRASSWLRALSAFGCHLRLGLLTASGTTVFPPLQVLGLRPYLPSRRRRRPAVDRGRRESPGRTPWADVELFSSVLRPCPPRPPITRAWTADAPAARLRERQAAARLAKELGLSLRPPALWRADRESAVPADSLNRARVPAGPSTSVSPPPPPTKEVLTAAGPMLWPPASPWWSVRYEHRTRFSGTARPSCIDHADARAGLAGCRAACAGPRAGRARQIRRPCPHDTWTGATASWSSAARWAVPVRAEDRL